MDKNKFEGYLDDAIKKYENDPEFIAEGLALKVTEEMLAILEKKGKNQSWLAEEMGVTRAHISKIMNARPNMTLLTIARIAVALSTKPEISINSPAPSIATKVRASVLDDILILENQGNSNQMNGGMQYATA